MPENTTQRFFSNSKRLLAGGIGGQLISLAALPFLARLYGPEEFGLVAMALLATGTAQVVASLRIDFTIGRTRKRVLARLLLGVSLIWSAAISTAITLAAAALLLALDQTAHLNLLVATGLNVLLGSVYALLLGGILHTGDMKTQMQANIIQMGAAVTAQIIGATFFFPSASLFLSGINVGYLVAALFCLARNDFKPIAPRAKRQFISVWRVAYNDIRYGVKHSIIGVFSRAYPSPTISLVAGAFSGGQFAILQRLVFNPVLILSQALGRSMFHQLAQGSDVNRFKFFERFSFWSYIAAIGLATLSAPVGGHGLTYLLGQEWRQSELLIAPLILAAPNILLLELVQNRLVASNRQPIVVLARILGIVVGVLGLGSYYSHHSLELSVWFFSMSTAVPLFIVAKEFVQSNRRLFWSLIFAPAVYLLSYTMHISISNSPSVPGVGIYPAVATLLVGVTLTAVAAAKLLFIFKHIDSLST